MNGTGSNNIHFGVNLFIFAFGTAVISPTSYESYYEELPSSVMEYTNLQGNSWDQDIIVNESQNIQNFNSLKDFSNSLLSNMKDLDSDIMDVINKNYWELL